MTWLSMLRHGLGHDWALIAQLFHQRFPAVPRLKKVVKSVGVGHWGAGLSFGDSTLGFLAMWIGHAAAAGQAVVSGPWLVEYG